MTSDELYRAILAMDAYNRGYDAGITVDGNGLGTVTVGTAKGDQAARDVSFFAQAYTLAGGQVIISIRGTDNKLLDSGRLARNSTPSYSMASWILQSSLNRRLQFQRRANGSCYGASL